jgi:lipopolysaccharide/colanic/teichoic acid biosynthesis glycosyltransferase
MIYVEPTYVSHQAKGFAISGQKPRLDFDDVAMLKDKRILGLWKYFCLQSRRRIGELFFKVYPPETFLSIVERERALARRIGYSLSIVAVGLGDQLSEHALKNEVEQFAFLRVRSTDVLGWIDQKTLGIILPNTPPEGARNVAEDILQPLARRMPPLTYVVYHYPVEWFSHDKKQVEQPIAGDGDIRFDGEIISSKKEIKEFDDFMPALERERSLSYRVGFTLSFIVFNLEDRYHNLVLRKELEEIVLQRVRAADIVGWLDHMRLGIVMPNTPGEGGKKLAESICQNITHILPPPAYKVYIYPTGGFPVWDDYSQSSKEQHDFAEVVSRDMPSRWVSNQSVHGEYCLIYSHPTAKHVGLDRLNNIFIRPIPRWKRTMDVVGAFIGIIVFLPLMLWTAVAIRLSSPGPVIFKQKRAGRGGKPFDLYKFRTMVVGADELKTFLSIRNEQTGPVFKISDDPRVTRVGRFLRKYSIDELPQLMNVLQGDMTLVGPRPPTLDEVPRYDQWHYQRLEVTPGLSCIWQVSGRNEIAFEDWVRMDICYKNASSFRNDLKILLHTLPAVVSGRGAY